MIMKMIVTIVDDQDANRVMAALAERHIGVTCVSSTGGLIIPGSSTLLIGVDDLRVPQVMKIIAELASLRESHVPLSYTGDISLASYVEVHVGGFLSYVLDVDQFEQV
jgi:uncharacterized protein YaaQ